MHGEGKSFDAFQADAEQQTGFAPAEAANQSLAGRAAIGTILGTAAGAAIGAATGNPAAGAAIGSASGLGLGSGPFLRGDSWQGRGFTVVHVSHPKGA